MGDANHSEDFLQDETPYMENCDGCGDVFPVQRLAPGYPFWPGLACATCQRDKMTVEHTQPACEIITGLKQEQPQGMPLLIVPAMPAGKTPSCWVWIKGKRLLVDTQTSALTIQVDRCLWKPDRWSVRGLSFLVMSTAVYSQEEQLECACCRMTRMEWRNQAQEQGAPGPWWIFPGLCPAYENTRSYLDPHLADRTSPSRY